MPVDAAASADDAPATGGDAPDALAADQGMPNVADASADAWDAGSDAPDASPEAPADLADAGKAMLEAPSQLTLSASRGCTSVSTVRISNRGGTATRMLALQTYEPFAIGANTCSGQVVAPGGSCDVEIRFTPQGIGPSTTVLYVFAGETMATVMLKGTGFDERWPLSITTPPDFGFVRIGRTVTAKTTVSLASDASEPISSFMVTVSGQDFTMTKDACQGIPVKPGQSCELEVSFTPSALGPRSATLTVSAPGVCTGSPITAALSGTAGPAAGPLQIEPVGIDTGISSSSCWTLTPAHVSNAGTATTAPLVVSLTGEGFSLETDGCTGEALPAGGRCDLVVRFKARFLGQAQGTLTVTAGSAMDQVPLWGTGTPSEGLLDHAPWSLHFGNVPLGGSSQKQRVTFRPLWGYADLSKITTKVVGDEFEIVEDQCTGAVLGTTGTTCALDVVFKPRSSSQRTGELILTVPFERCLPEEHHIPLDGSGSP